jgi:vancomycin resistance protein YoaR
MNAFPPSDPSPLGAQPRHVSSTRGGASLRRPRLGRALLAIAGLLSAVLALGGVALANHVDGAAVVPRVKIDGQEVEGARQRETVEAFVRARAKANLQRKIAWTLEGRDAPVFEATLEDLGVRIDESATVRRAMEIGHEADWGVRVLNLRAAYARQINVPLVVYVDMAKATERFSAVKRSEDLEPVAARIDLEKHEITPERPGRSLEVSEAVTALEAALNAPMLPARLPFPEKNLAATSSSFVKNLDISTVLGEFETSFSRRGDQQRRGKNIDNAAKRLDGIVIAPGETFSFNAAVGDRSVENGFEKSWEIFKGEMVEGIGGGTCQVASTFHAASFFAGLEVLERLPHSRPSAYIPMGLDATVVYPDVDLKVRNPHPFPVVLHTKTTGAKLHVEILGKTRAARVRFSREVTETLPYARKVEEDPTLTGKRVLVKQHGIQGYKVKRYRHFVFPDGTTKRQEWKDTYPPTTELYRVPVGFDVALLPAVPVADERAKKARELAVAEPADKRVASAQPGPSVEVIEAPGVHAPTEAQRDAVKSLQLAR